MALLEIDLWELFHDISDPEDKCMDRLIGSLKKRDGIADLNIVHKNTPDPRLCITFDPDIITESQVQKITCETAKKLDETFGHLRIKVNDSQNSRRLKAASTLMDNVTGVMNVLVIPTGIMIIEFNKYITQESLLKELIEKMDLVL